MVRRGGASVELLHGRAGSQGSSDRLGRRKRRAVGELAGEQVAERGAPADRGGAEEEEGGARGAARARSGDGRARPGPRGPAGLRRRCGRARERCRPLIGWRWWRTLSGPGRTRPVRGGAKFLGLGWFWIRNFRRVAYI